MCLFFFNFQTTHELPLQFFNSILSLFPLLFCICIFHSLISKSPIQFPLIQLPQTPNMPLETWLFKVKKTISQTLDSPRVINRSKVSVLAFEVAGIMPKITHVWRFLSHENIHQIRNNSICLEGVRKIVSNKDQFLMSLACAELVENVKVIASVVGRMSERCEDSSLRGFQHVFDVFANTGQDPYAWVLNMRDMEVKVKKMDRYVSATAALYKAMDELTVIESSLKKLLHCNNNNKKEQKILDLQQKLIWQKQEVTHVKDKSLWNTSFDSVTLLLATSVFTILSRITFMFGIAQGYPYALPRRISASATIYPSNQSSKDWNLASGPLIKSAKHQENNEISHGFFETNSKILTPASNTLGFSALSLHYANLIIVMEKMIRSPQLVGLDARDDLYSMLPNSIRSLLRSRLKGIGFRASDPVLAGEWREALGKILWWLAPLAHNMIKWHNERSFEHQNLMPKTNVLLLQTLFFANREKTEAAITELLVGLNYIWRFEREMNGKALFNCIIPAK